LQFTSDQEISDAKRTCEDWHAANKVHLPPADLPMRYPGHPHARAAGLALARRCE